MDEARQVGCTEDNERQDMNPPQRVASTGHDAVDCVDEHGELEHAAGDVPGTETKQER